MSFHFRFFIGLIIFLLCPVSSFAYPSFIGYGYTSCLTCHFNGAGGGALNDYGRALWSAEISSRALFPKSVSDEDLGAASGIAGSVELPSWLRPGVKYRSINVMRNPGSPASTDVPYLMQEDLDTAFIFDKDSNYLIDATYGYISNAEAARRGQANNNFILRNYYFRMQVTEGWWAYIGLMDKVFGIRNEDHTSFQRTAVGLTQYAQSEGLIVQKVSEKWDLTANIFAGNPQVTDQSAELKGSSIMGEYEPWEKTRFGISAMGSRSTLANFSAYSLHYRQGLTKGCSIMAEVGSTDTLANGLPEQDGQYLFIQTNFLLGRGYTLKTIIEKFNQNTLTVSPDQWKYQFGILAFPLPRLELRLDFVDLRTVVVNTANPDQWMIEGQVHVSL